MFTHLHTHSYFSFLDAVPSPSQLVEAAATDGMPALALTDTHLAGAVAFYDACLAAGVHPILGLEIQAAAPPDFDPALKGSLVLLATGLEGWASLCKLSSAVHATPGDPHPAGLTFEALTAETNGLLCLTGGIRSLVDQWVVQGQEAQAAQLLQQLAELFPDRLYVELQHGGRDHSPVWGRLQALANQAHLPVVATQAVYYLNAQDATIQHTLAAIRSNSTLARLPPEAAAPQGANFTTQEAMQEIFSEFPAALAATQEIASRCRLELPVDGLQYPQIDLPNGLSAEHMLREKAYEGAIERYGPLTPKISERLARELAIIGDSGYAVLFLIMQQIIQFTRRADIPISSRGSAASSLVAHCLGLTTPDPMRLNLYFERFLNPARRKPPDIDTDLCSQRRDEVIQFVYDHFGADRAAMVCTISRFRARSALREVAKAHGIQNRQIKALVSALPWRGWGPPRGSKPSAKTPFDELASRFPGKVYERLFAQAAQILGLPRHLSIHPGGMVISPGPMTDLVPTQGSSKGVMITQFDLEAVERLGLVKIDLLGIRGLSVLSEVADVVRSNSQGQLPSRLSALEAIPDRDAETAALVQSGRTIGCFQIESPGMQATLQEIQAQTPDDIMVALALYRPGPLTGGLKDAFVRRHLGQEEVQHLDPALEPLLADTHGVILYQEQVLRIAHDLAGLSLAESDLLRRAMSHFDPGERMKTLKEKFLAGALAHHSVPNDTAEQIWELMAAFAGYGFPKAHAASYAEIAWRSAWCKAHYPAQFMAAVLANWGGYYRQGTYLLEARHMGLSIRPPHVNYSLREFAVAYPAKEPALFMGLDQVKDLTRRTQKKIIRRRPFSSLADFLSRVDPRPAEAEALVRIGALDGLGATETMLQSLSGSAWQSGQMPLFEMEAPAAADWTPEDRAAAQEALLGASIDPHLLERLKDRLTGRDILSIGALAGRISETVMLLGQWQGWPRRVREASGSMRHILLADLEGMVDVVFSESLYRRFSGAITGQRPVLVEGTVERDPQTQQPRVRGEKIWKLASKSTIDKR